MTDRDTAAALAKALPGAINLDQGGWRGRGGSRGWRTDDIAAFQADRLAEAGWVLVRPDDEATVEVIARAMHAAFYDTPLNDETERWQDGTRKEARAALAALAAPRPGTADTAHTEKKIDPDLVRLLRDAGQRWGPLGVALAAAHETDVAALNAALSSDEQPDTQPDTAHTEVEA